MAYICLAEILRCWRQLFRLTGVFSLSTFENTATEAIKSTALEGRKIPRQGPREGPQGGGGEGGGALVSGALVTRGQVSLEGVQVVQGHLDTQLGLNNASIYPSF